MGCGHVATYGHLPAIAATRGLTLAALYDPNPAAAQAASQAFGAPAFTDEAAFFATDLDAVVVTSPAPAHLDNIRAAAAHKLHVLCEKPLAMTQDDIRQMIAIMHAAKRQLFTAFCYRFSPAALKIKRLLEARAIGDLRSLRLIYIWTCHGKYAKDARGRICINARREGRMLEGGPMVDCGVHQIDLARWWAGEVAASTSHGAWVDEYAAPDHMYLHMDHAAGAHTMVEISYSYSHTAKDRLAHFSYHLIGTEGLIRYDGDTKTFELRNRKKTIDLGYAPEKNFDGMYKAFAQFLKTGNPGDLPTADDGLAATQIARTATDALIQ